MKRLIYALVAILLVAALLAGCSKPVEPTPPPPVSPSGPKKGGTFVVDMPGDPETFNPVARVDDVFWGIAQNVYSRLIKLNNDQAITGDLAKSWDVSDDGLTVTFKLHENVKWHDGTPFTSKDVKFTFDSAFANESFVTSMIATLQETTCPDDNTVVMKLANPDATFLGYLAWYGTFIVPEHVFSGDNWDKGTEVNPVGTGPFKFVDWKPGVSVTIERFDDYFVQAPYLDKVVYSVITDPTTATQAFLNGEIDQLGSVQTQDIPSLMANPDVTSRMFSMPSRYYFVLNNSKAPFDNLKMRQAFAYALDNDELVEKATNGVNEAAKYWVSPMYDWCVNKDATIPPFDAQKAISLIEEAGYTKGADGNYMTIKALVVDSGAFKPLTEVAKEQLGRIGINVDLTMLEISAWFAGIEAGEFDMVMYNGYQGPEVGCLGSRIMTGASNNQMRYSNPELDKLMDDAMKLASESQKAERAAKYKAVQAILAEDLPMYPVCEWSGISPVRSYVKGDPLHDLDVLPITGFAEFTYVWLDK